MFKKMPKLGYIFNGSFVTVTDILRRVAPVDENLNDLILEYYEIQSGEQPEDVAYKIYGDPKLYWTILLVNNIVDPYNEWYMSDEVLREFVDQKYGVGNSANTHHWILPERPEICVEYDRAKLANGEIEEVSHLRHEEIENDNRQNIKIVSKRYILDFVNEFNQLMNQ
jgi:hypothetical protein